MQVFPIRVTQLLTTPMHQVPCLDDDLDLEEFRPQHDTVSVAPVSSWDYTRAKRSYGPAIALRNLRVGAAVGGDVVRLTRRLGE